MSTRDSRVGFALALAACVVGCVDDANAPTQIVVIVDAEPGVRARTAVLKLVVKSLGDETTTVSNETLRAQDREIEWPWLIGLVPKDGDASRQFEVVATALDAHGGFVAEARARSGFVKGEKRALNLLLEDACIGVDDCAEDQTCHAGTCRDAYLDPLQLPPFDENDVPEPIVVGPPDQDAGSKDDAMVVPMFDAGEDGAVPNDSGGGFDAQASPGCRPNPNRQNEVCPEICPESCNGEDDDCDLRIDEGEADDECDSLDHAIGACDKGECVVVQCQKNWRDCDKDATTGCESGQDDVDNCGACGHACEFVNMIPACMGGDCVPIGCVDLFDDCDADPDDCETPTTTLTDCGGCGIPCEDVPHADPTCAPGYCGPGACVGNFGDCDQEPGNGCEQELNTLADCAACGQSCDFGGSLEDCGTGVCLATGCVGNYDDCDLDPSNGCESLESDADCGACGQTCDASLANVDTAGCTPGGCVVDCSAAFGDCDLDTFNGCEASVETIDRCGDCDTPCAIPHAVVSCATGTCEFVRCEMGWGDCANGVIDGCEQSLDVPEYCGDCLNDCTGMVGTTFCAGGQCSAVNCAPGTADCDGLNADCEVDLTTDEANCGGCDFACAFDGGVMPHASGLSCVASQCEPQCDAGYDDCNANYVDGCEVALTTLTDCGACGAGCSISNATATCATGTCEVATCATDFDDCDANGTSCETPLDTTSDCGACDNACDDLAHAFEMCGGSPGAHTCLMGLCTDAFYQDCDDLDATGCEVDTRTDAANCGACERDCAAEPQVTSASCADSACVYDQCDIGYGDCTGAIGCETALGTPENCSACDDACDALPNTKETTCESMACAITSCDSGFASCDGSDATGCETSIYTAANCGGCASADANQPCTNLPNVMQSTCPAGACVIDQCVGEWLDCDGVVVNGCEHNGAAPPGGLGPCEPDTNCTKFENLGQSYWFCTNDRDWPSARARCQLQLLGDLVRIDDATENMFVTAHLAQVSWIGASDETIEGQWRWADNGVQFWQGAAGGAPVDALYNAWASGEPSASGNCARIALAGTWADDDCTALRNDFVCEVQSDLCPLDPSKSHPGQCGCGVPDTDTDGDGTADCNDACQDDPLKVQPGVCGCGVPDVDSDGDGVMDCNDQCPGTPDADTDGDAILDCLDPCPYAPGEGPESGQCPYAYRPSNFDPDSISFSGAPHAELDCDIQIDTTDPDGLLGPGVVTLSGWCGPSDKPAFEVQSQTDGPDVVIMVVSSLTLARDNTLRVIGNRPLVIAALGDVTIDGIVSARALGTTPGAGGNVSCGAGLGDAGTNAPTNAAGAGGGGGGAYGAGGGKGGSGYRFLSMVAGGLGGSPEGLSTIVPLRGGCRGGFGGAGAAAADVLGGAPGSGGGAIQISAAGRMRVTATGVVTASGGGGLAGGTASDGGGGGGSGGAVLLEGGGLWVDADGWITANGGGGGAGNAPTGATGNPGTDGFTASGVRAPGGYAPGSGGGGGLGGASDGAATGGQNGAVGMVGGGGGGGGGGGVGRVYGRGALQCVLVGSSSPAGVSPSCP